MKIQLDTEARLLKLIKNKKFENDLLLKENEEISSFLTSNINKLQLQKEKLHLKVDIKIDLLTLKQTKVQVSQILKRETSKKQMNLIYLNIIFKNHVILLKW